MATDLSNKSPLPKKKKGDVVLLSFPKAIEALITGKKIRRVEWGDSGEYGLLKDSFLSIYRGEKFYTWTVSEGDMSAIDWVVFN